MTPMKPLPPTRFTVTGLTTAGHPYDVVLDERGDFDRTVLPVWGAVVSWTPHAAALLRSLIGEDVTAGPSGRSYTVDPYDAESLLAALYCHTQVLRVAGAVPDVIGELPAGAVG